jgi:ferredoxin-NADP reductase
LRAKVAFLRPLSFSRFGSGSDPSSFVDFENPNNLFALVERDDKKQFPLKLAAREKLTHDTNKYTLAFPNPEWVSGLHPSGHFTFHAMIDGKLVKRQYTPISPVNMKGKAEFVIKTYRPNDQFPEGGKFTQYLQDDLKIGDDLLCSGPIGKTKYYGNGRFTLGGNELKPKKHLGLLAGGTGITPALSLATASVLSGDTMDVTLVFSNKTKDDILCADHIEQLQN